MNPDKFTGFFLSLAVTAMLGCSRQPQTADDFRVETVSPRGTYRLIFEGRREPPGVDGMFQSERVKLTVMKGREVFYSDDPFFEEGSLDPHFAQLFPALQWFNDSTLRMGEELSRQPFSDEIVFHNRAGEKLDVVEVRYGRDERFFIFDFGPGENVEVKANPQFRGLGPDFRGRGVAAYWVAYRAHYKGEIIAGEVEGRKRERVAGGPLKYSVEITAPVAEPNSHTSFNRTRN